MPAKISRLLSMSILCQAGKAQSFTTHNASTSTINQHEKLFQVADGQIKNSSKTQHPTAGMRLTLENSMVVGDLMKKQIIKRRKKNKRASCCSYFIDKEAALSRKEIKKYFRRKRHEVFFFLGSSRSPPNNWNVTIKFIKLRSEAFFSYFCSYLFI